MNTAAMTASFSCTKGGAGCERVRSGKSRRKSSRERGRERGHGTVVCSTLIYYRSAARAAQITIKESAVSMNRRQFVTRSVLSLGAIGLARRSAVAQAGATGAGSGGTGPAGNQVRRDPPRCRLLHRQRRNHRISREWRRRDRDRQPVHADRRDLRRRPQTAGAQGHRAVDQHPPPRRPHQRQWRVPPRCEAHPRPRELRHLAAQGRRGGRREAARAGRRAARAARRGGFDVQGHLDASISATRRCTCGTSVLDTRAATP